MYFSLFVKLFHLFVFFFFSSRRRHTRLQGDWSSDVCSSDLLERAGHLRLRGRIWRNGPPPPGNDPRLRRSRSIRTVSLALHFCADFPTRCLRSFLLVGSERNRSRRFLLGCLAWDDADLWLLSNLRREDGLLRHADASPRLRDLCHLVCGGGAPFLATHD